MPTSSVPKKVLKVADEHEPILLTRSRVKADIYVMKSRTEALPRWIAVWGNVAVCSCPRVVNEKPQMCYHIRRVLAQRASRRRRSKVLAKR